jgi:glutathione S-transferase
MSVKPIKLYRHILSGHCHRVELMLSLLGIPVELIDVDLANRAHKQPAFLQLNTFGQVPVIDDDGVILADSNAILVYLAKRYAPGKWLPEDPVSAANIQRWLSAAAGPLAFGAARARLITVFGAPYNSQEVIGAAHALLSVMNTELLRGAFLIGDQPTIADIAGYSYIAHAPEGNVSLQDYPQVRAWLQRIEALPGFVPMKKSAVGLNAGTNDGHQ